MAYITTGLLVTRTHSSSVEASAMSSESLFSYAAGWLSIRGASEVGKSSRHSGAGLYYFVIVRTQINGSSSHGLISRSLESDPSL